MNTRTLETHRAPDAPDTTTVHLACRRPAAGPPVSPRMGDVAFRFGLTTGTPSEWIIKPLKLSLGKGRIVLITGPSGSGKSTLLRQIQQAFPDAQNVTQTALPAGKAVVDLVCPTEPLHHALELLSACGLGESPIWLRSADQISDGERFRVRLARAVGRHRKTRPTAPLLCDEFCSGLHRRLAKAVSYNLRKLVTRHRLSVVVAASNEDVAADLQPDRIVRLLGDGQAEGSEPLRRNRPISFARRLILEPGKKADYDPFAAMHYRASDELGFVDRVFTLREGPGGDLLGIVVYAHGPLELALRNQATDNRFRRNPKRLNREVRILRRLVIHPDVRGCGLGHWLVRRTLPLVGTPFVECLASMGEVNPVFEKAGMKRIGLCTVPPDRALVVEKLHAIDADPFSREFVSQVARRPRVRRVVARVVHDWYQATTAGGEKRVARQSTQFLAQTFRNIVGCRPVYYLWQRPDVKRPAPRVDRPRRRRPRDPSRHRPARPSPVPDRDA